MQADSMDGSMYELMSAKQLQSKSAIGSSNVVISQSGSAKSITPAIVKSSKPQTTPLRIEEETGDLEETESEQARALS